MSSNTPNQGRRPGDRGDGSGRFRDADLFASPDLVHRVLENIRNLEQAHPGRGTRVSDTLVQNSIRRHLGSYGQEGLSSYQRNLRTLHNDEITDNFDESIGSTRTTLAAIPPDHPFRAAHHNELGILLRWKFDNTASLDDIDEAIQYGQQAVNAMPPGFTRSLFLSHLARSLCSRFTKSGEITDLDEAVQKGREAVAGTPPGYPNRATCLNNLGNILVTLFSTSKCTMADMDEAINCGLQSLEALSPRTPRRASFLQELASWFVKKFEKTVALADLDEAIRYGLQAVDTTPSGHRDRPARLKKLSVIYGLRFERTRAKEDLERASRYAREATSVASPENPDRSSQQIEPKANEANLSMTSPVSGLGGVLSGNTPDWPDLQACRVGDAVGLANIASGRARVRMDQLLEGRFALELEDDPDGEQQLSRMCATCADLKLKGEDFLPRPFSKPGTSREERDVLFSRGFQAIEMESQCSLCKFIVFALRTSCPHVVSWENLNCTLYLARFSSYYDHEESHESFRFLTVEGHVPNQEDPVCSADMLPVESDFFRHSFIGRTVSPRISPAMIRRWIQQCEVIHGEKCSRLEIPGYNQEFPPSSDQTRFDDLRPSLYFVDVHFNCLTRIPSGGRYVALSYVWGSVKSIRAYHCTIERLKNPGGLWLSRYQLPAVINDAIGLVADIGERYLWVDSLCILQDDSDHKQAAISQMNLIYENALLTIVAADGMDATAGLPGMGSRPRSQSQRCDVIGPRLKMIVPHWLETLDRSKWASRAWTFQEYFASPRRLIFVNGQVVLKCSWDSPCREDIVSEYQTFGMEDYVYKLPGPRIPERALLKLIGKASSSMLAHLITAYSEVNC